MTTAGSLYGRSLYELAAEEQLTERILKEMKTVKELLAENPDYVTLLSEPSIPKKERLKLVDEAFQEDLQPYLVNFIKLLLENNMLREFAACFRAFRAEYNKAHGIADAVVTSAVALDDAQRRELRERLEKLSGKTVELTEKVDPGILGGLKVELDGRLYDGTVQSRLNSIRKKVSETVI